MTKLTAMCKDLSNAQSEKVTAAGAEEKHAKEVALLQARVVELTNAEQAAQSKGKAVLRDCEQLKAKLKHAKQTNTGQDEQMESIIGEFCEQIQGDAKIIEELKREKDELSIFLRTSGAGASDEIRAAELVAMVKDRDELRAQVAALTEECTAEDHEEDGIQNEFGTGTTRLKRRPTDSANSTETVNALSSENAHLQDQVADALFEAETARRKMREMEDQIKSDFNLIAQLSSELEGTQQQRAWPGVGVHHSSQSTLTQRAEPAQMAPAPVPLARSTAPTMLQRWAGRPTTNINPASSAAALPSMTQSNESGSFLRWVVVIANVALCHTMLVVQYRASVWPQHPSRKLRFEC